MSRTIQNAKIGSLLLILVLVLGACGGGASSDTTEAAAATEASETTVGETAETTGVTEETTGGAVTTAETGGGGDGEPIVLGTAFPLSGPGSYFGVQNNEAIDLILEQWGGSVEGHPIEVHSEDSQCSPLEATNAAERLVNEFEPDIIFGEECSSATLAIMPIVERAGIPLVNAGSSSILITEPGNDWTFRIMPNEVMQGISIATNAVNELGASRAVILHENTDAGIGNADAFTETFESLGGEVVDRIGFDREVQDFTSIASRIAGVDDVDVIPTYSLEGQGVNITQALAQAGVTPGGGGTAIQLGTIWLPDTFEEKAGASAEGYIRILQYLPEDPRPIVQDFVSAFEEKYGRTPTHINAHTYDLMQLLKDVIERGGTDPESIRTALMETDGLEGVTGHITFDETGQNIETDTIHYVRTLADGTLEVLDWEP